MKVILTNTELVIKKKDPNVVILEDGIAEGWVNGTAFLIASTYDAETNRTFPPNGTKLKVTVWTDEPLQGNIETVGAFISCPYTFGQSTNSALSNSISIKDNSEHFTSPVTWDFVTTNRPSSTGETRVPGIRLYIKGATNFPRFHAKIVRIEE